MGRALGAANAKALSHFVTMNYISTIETKKIYLANQDMRVVKIVGCPRVAGNDGSDVTLEFYKSASAAAVGAGTKLHYGTYDVKGTADANQELTLIPDGVDYGDPTALELSSGDSLGFVLTGTATLAVGTVTITLEPVEN